MNNFYFYQTELDEKQPSYLVCYCAGSGFDLAYFYDELVKQFRDCIFTRNLVLISAAFNRDVIKSKLLNIVALDKLKDRINTFQELNVHTCFIEQNGNYDISISKHNVLAQIEELTNIQLNQLAESGVFQIIKKRNLLIEASANFHFVKPSGKHTDKFISVSNMLESSPEISFIAILLLKFVPAKLSKIYVDTSGIFTLAHELANLHNSFINSSKIVSVDSFGSYGGLEEYQFSSDPNTLVLISASTSNDLYKRLKKDSSLEQAAIVSVVMSQSNTSQQKVLIEFRQYKDTHCKEYFRHFDSYKEDDCPMCLNEHSIPIALDKSKFVFETPRTESCLPLATDSEPALKKLIGRYKNLDVFRCLFDGLAGTTIPTPEYFIDVSKLVLNSEDYKILVKNAVLRHFPINADCIIHCKDKGAKELADFIAIEVKDLHKKVNVVEGEFNENIQPKNGIVVVAGSIQSGKSLLNISRYLRKYPHLPVTYIVGFAKYNSDAEFTKLQKDLTFSDGPCGKHKFHAIEKLLLPIGEHKKDSWVKELDILKRLEQEHREQPELKELVKERISLLKKASSSDKQGLGAKLFLKSSTRNEMILGPTFAFWNKSDTTEQFEHHSTVYYTISSILQKLRTVARKNGVIPLGDGYIVRQLDPLLFDRFNEGIIQSSILRAAKSRELDFSADDSKSRIVGSLIERMLKYPSLKESEALPEFLLALCTKKLQVKKDHLICLKGHEIEATQYSFVWMLAEYAKGVLFEENTTSAPNF